MPKAIDLFCGAGGFSEGILQSGFDIVFSSDRSIEVMKTYTNRHERLGIIEGKHTHFELCDIKELTGEKIFKAINNLEEFKTTHIAKGDIDVIFGGPPCQGFSRAGKRDANDPRNMLFHEYLRIIKEVKPKYVVMENVTGFMDMQMLDFPSVINDKAYMGQVLVSEILQKELKDIGYNVIKPQVLNAADYGVPQNRKRIIFLAYLEGNTKPNYPEPSNRRVTVKEALSGINNNGKSSYHRESRKGRTLDIHGEYVCNFEIMNNDMSVHTKSVKQRFSLYENGEDTKNLKDRILKEPINLKEKYPELFYETLFFVNKDSNIIGLKQILASSNSKLTESELSNYRWLNDTNKLLGMIFSKPENIEMLILKLKKRLKINDVEGLIKKFESQLNKIVTPLELELAFKLGKPSANMIEALLTRKNMRRRLNKDGQSPTIVTLPDDFIHPFEDRVLSVREMARLQSFDDSFEFLGKRTTGGVKRKSEVPQYTQVGNAVPPLLAKAIADSIKDAINKKSNPL
ncbi:DNA cytosine methyltransferase [Brochothrix thermosphacta]|uniref:DNA cytosine methyltransferase n=1 Tax=Brochothrix thermosphacta TaxID=2756 RepID=UPI0026A4B2CB